MPPRSRPWILVPALGASVAMLLWMGRSLVTGEIPFTGDLLHWNYPIRDFYAGAISKGQRPFWMPSIYGGFDIAGEGQLGIFHPFHWVLYRLVPLDRAFAFELAAPYVLLFCGTWLLLRRTVEAAPAAFGALLFTFCGFNLQHGVHMNMVAIVAHIPWLLWLCDRALTAGTARDRRLIFAGIGIVTGSQVLLGHPQAVWWSVLLAASYVAYHVATDSRVARGAATWTVAAGLLAGAGIGAVQLLSTFYEAQHSTRRAGDLAFAASFSLPPLQLLQLLEPYLFWGRLLRWNEASGAGDEYGVYAGAVGLALAVWWVADSVGRRRKETTPGVRLAWWGLLMAVAGLWLCIGRAGGLYDLQTWLPVVGEFRAPVRYILFTHFGLALVSAVALTQLAEAGVDRRRAVASAVWAPWVLAAASAAIAYWLTRSGRTPAAAVPVAIMGPALFAAAALLITLAARGARPALLALVLLAAGDHALYGLGGIVAWQDFVTRAQAEAFLDERTAHISPDDGRVARGGFPNLHVLAGYQLIDGYVGLQPAKALDYRSPNALLVAGVHYAHADFLQGRTAAGAVALAHGWFELPRPLPRARLVTSAYVTSEPAVDIDRVDVAAIALSTHPLPLSGGEPGAASIVDAEPGDLRISTEAPGRQLLVVSESYDAGWSAEVDGAVAPVEQLYGDFLGVVVPGGRHDVRLVFSPPYYRAGRAISIASLAGVLLVLASAVRRELDPGAAPG